MRKCSSLDWSFFVLAESRKVTCSEYLTSLVSSDRQFASHCAVFHLFVVIVLFICIYDRVSIVQLDNLYHVLIAPKNLSINLKTSPDLNHAEKLSHPPKKKSQKVLRTCRSSSCLHLKTWILQRDPSQWRCHIEVGLGQLLRWSRKTTRWCFMGFHVDTARKLSGNRPKITRALWKSGIVCRMLHSHQMHQFFDTIGKAHQTPLQGLKNPRHPNTSWEGVLGTFLGSKYLVGRCLDVWGNIHSPLPTVGQKSCTTSHASTNPCEKWHKLSTSLD